MVRKEIIIVLLLFSGIYSHAQFRKNQSKDGGLFFKGSIGRGFSFKSYKLPFTSNSGAFADVILMPGGSYNLLFGTGIRAKYFDFDFMVEEAIIFGASASASNSGTVTFSASFLKTHIYGTAYLKAPFKKGKNSLRIGCGPYVTIPGKFKVTLDGERLGYSAYETTIGFNADANLLFALKNYFINPGLRVKIAELQSSEITFTQNVDQLERLKCSGLDFYLALQF